MSPQSLACGAHIRHSQDAATFSLMSVTIYDSLPDCLQVGQHVTVGSSGAFAEYVIAGVASCYPVQQASAEAVAVSLSGLTAAGALEVGNALFNYILYSSCMMASESLQSIVQMYQDDALIDECAACAISGACTAALSMPKHQDKPLVTACTASGPGSNSPCKTIFPCECKSLI